MRTYLWKKYRIKNSGENLSILNQRTSFWKPFILILPSLLTILLFTLIPFIIVVIQSIKIENQFSKDDFTIGLDNFGNLFKQPKFITGIRNSLVYSLTALPLSLLISILISAAITQVVKKWAQGFWQTVFFLPYITSAVAVSLSFFYLFKRDGGIVNNILQALKLIKRPIPFLESGEISGWLAFSVILIRGIWGNLAFQVLILTTAMLSVNPQLYKAAAIDGSQKSQQFFKITLPSIKRTISFLITMGLIGGIKVMPLALFNNNAGDAVNNGGSSLMLYIYNAITEGKLAIAGAASVVLFIIGIAYSFTLRKLVTFIYKLIVRSDNNNVVNKIKNQAILTKAIFKV
ncbi:carbohydrate ABC transporter permease [Metamycoplasma buccale]|uniref:carbohydrate ABC transporter permease n=1 Tax=Metamycoplasma buccale TaxID=55602 RepID=UPI00398F26C2